MAEKYGQAGKSTRQMAEKRRCKILIWGIISIAAVLTAYFLLKNMKQLGIGGGVGLILLLLIRFIPDLFDKKSTRIKKEERRAVRGAIAEEVVSDHLDQLDENFLVFHDIKSRYGNIDHIVINKQNGIFLLETKSHGGKVEVVDGNLLLNGHATEKDFIGQALRNSYWLREKVNEVTGVTPWITPVLVFTNAFVVANKGIKGVRVVNKKYLLGILYSKANPSKSNEVLWEKREQVKSLLLTE